MFFFFFFFPKGCWIQEVSFVSPAVFKSVQLISSGFNGSLLSQLDLKLGAQLGVLDCCLRDTARDQNIQGCTTH